MAHSGCYPRPASYGPSATAGLETAALGGPCDPIVAELRARGIRPGQTEVVVAELPMLRGRVACPERADQPDARLDARPRRRRRPHPRRPRDGPAAIRLGRRGSPRVP